MSFFFLMIAGTFACHAQLHSSQSSGWRKSWYDEFDGTAIDGSKWSTKYYPWGAHNLVGGDATSQGEHSESYLEDGNLVLRVSNNPSYPASGRPYLHGIAHSGYTKGRWKYGYLEIRAKYPTHKKSWPAFWMLAYGWPPEIDVAEYFGNGRGMHMGLYGYGSYWQSAHDQGDVASWHTYGLEWGPGYLIWYKDGQQKHRVYSSSQVPNESMYVMLNSGMNSSSGDGPVPNYYVIDYFRYSPPPYAAIDDNKTGTGLHQCNYSGTWGTGSYSDCFYGGVHWSGTANNYVTVQFYGTRVDVIGRQATSEGIIAYSVDGGPETLVDSYSTNDSHSALLWSGKGLPRGMHTLKMRVTGTKNPSATGTSLTLDRVNVWSTAPCLTGTLVGTAGSYNNTGNTRDRATDGNMTTFFDGPTTDGAWVGYDLETSQQITKVSYCPRSGNATRMVGGKFQGANSANFGDAVDLFSIPSAPSEGVMTDQAITNTNAFRYVRYLSPAGGSGNVAEVEFHGVVAPNGVPSFTGDPITKLAATEGAAYTGTLVGSATDSDTGEPLIYSKVNGPAWLTVAENGALSGTPGAGDVGNSSWTVRATDSQGATDDATLNITVNGFPLPTEWTAADIGAVGSAGAATYSSGTYTVRGSGADISGTADEFRFVNQPVTGDCDIRARVTSQTDTNSWAKAGVMIRNGTAANARHAMMIITPDNGFAFQYRSATGGNLTHVAGPTLNATPNNWVRVVRSGNIVRGYVSADGANGSNWTLVGAANITMTSAVNVGLAVCSHADGTLGTATFDGVSVVALPSSWQSWDVGAVGAGGSAIQMNGTYTVRGSGADIYGTADEFRYVYQQATGDCEIRARVNSIDNTNPWAKAGIMIRESLDASSKHALLVLTPANGVAFQRRLTTGGNSENTSANGLSAPYWIRIVRTGNTFIGYRSSDPNLSGWTSMGAVTINMSNNVHIGLAVTSHNDGVLCTTTFDANTMTIIADNDGDGMQNAWEDANGFDKFDNTDAADDQDGDGQSNLAEYIAGTDPRNGASVFRLAIAKIPSGFRLEFSAQAGKTYAIQYCDSLAAGPWSKLADVPAPEATHDMTYEDLTAAPRRFYRVTVVQPLQP